MADAGNPVTTLLRAAAERGGRLGLMGQVMVTCPGAASPNGPSAALRVLALNDSGLSGGGAAIAHRRLVDALRLAGSDIDVVALFDVSTKAAAERTRAFPEIERRVAERTYDLALIGNIHGATRSVDVLRRINRTVPVAVVTHDLFMLTWPMRDAARLRQAEGWLRRDMPDSGRLPGTPPYRHRPRLARETRLPSGPTSPSAPGQFGVDGRR